MPALRITPAAATTEDLEAARGLDLRATSRGELRSGLGLLALGIIAMVAGYRITSVNFMGVFIALAGCIAIAAGLMKLLSWRASVAVGRELQRELAEVTRPGRVVLVEIEAARLFSAPSVDEDARAVVVADGHGGGIYLNTPWLDELDPDDAGLPRSIRLRLTGRGGIILAGEAQGPRVPAVAGPGSMPCEPGGVGAEAVILPTPETPPEWRRLLEG